MKKVLLCLCVVFTVLGMVVAGESTPESKVLEARVWRDYSPPNPPSGLFASVDSQEEVVEIELTLISFASGIKEKWASPLKFTYLLEEAKPARGARYHSTKTGPKWPTGRKVLVMIKLKKDNKWINVGETEIGQTN